MGLLDSKLEEQKIEGFVGETEINTTRVVKKLKDYESAQSIQDMIFAVVEFIQNSADFVRKLLEESAKQHKTRIAKVERGDKQIEWLLELHL